MQNKQTCPLFWHIDSTATQDRLILISRSRTPGCRFFAWLSGLAEGCRAAKRAVDAHTPNVAPVQILEGPGYFKPI